jgi:hypothetical protein
MHQECVKMDLSETTAPGFGVVDSQKNAIKTMFTAQQAEVAHKVVRWLYSVFNDAKRGTLSAWSWPSREVSFMFGVETASVITSQDVPNQLPISLQQCHLQYLVPSMHAELLQCIVDADKTRVKNKLLNSMAISLRLDGSVDRTQIDNIHAIARIVTSDGKSENVFLGIAEPVDRGAKGYASAVGTAVSFVAEWKDLFPKVTSIVTDGASINVGQKNGLWALLQKSRDDSQNNSVPLMKVWCTVHKSALAWKNVCSNVTELQTLIIDLTGIAAYFRQSGIRTRELRAVAKDIGAKVYSMPKFFEVRWAEFTYFLCRAAIGSWQAIVTYLKSGPNNEATPFFIKWTEHGRFQLVRFVTDVTFVFSRFQKSLQSESSFV